MSVAHRAALSFLIVLMSACGEPDPSTTALIPQPDMSLIAEERLVQAVQVARASVIESPQSAGAWGRLGNVYLIHGWEAEASLCYRQAAETEPGQFRWHYFLGRSLEDLDPASASDALAKALVLDGNYTAAHHARARVLRGLGLAGEAHAHLLRAVELDPGDALAQLGLGEVALEAQDFELAREHLERALALDAGLTEAHRALARVYSVLGNLAEAQQHAEAGLEPGPERLPPDPLWDELERTGVTKYWISRRANRYLQQKQYEKAVVEFYRAADDSERNPMFWYNFGNALRNTGRYAKAVEIYKRALQALEDPYYSSRIDQQQKAKIYNNLCIAHASDRNLNAAEKCFRDALDIYPASVELTTNLMILYYRQARFEEAIRMLEASPVTGTSESLKQALDRLLRERSTAPGGEINP